MKTTCSSESVTPLRVEAPVQSAAVGPVVLLILQTVSKGEEALWGNRSENHHFRLWEETGKVPAVQTWIQTEPRVPVEKEIIIISFMLTYG